MIKIAITGAKGRMGRTVQACAARQDDVTVVGEVDLGDALEPVLTQAEVVIDFSLHDATANLAECCAQHGVPLVTGTTGHNAEEKARITAAATRIPMVWASNFATGVNALFWLARQAAGILGPDFDLEVIEMHHRLKKDAPSGTATTLAEILAEARKQKLADVIRHGRQGITGERTSTEIGMHSLRGGDVVGEHTVVFATQGERLELTHRASSRDMFANGALNAARWIIGKPPGIYSMQDVLGLKE